MEQANNKKINRLGMKIIVFMLIFTGGMAGGYLYLSKNFFKYSPPSDTGGEVYDEVTVLRIYYPSESGLQMEERRVKKTTSMLSQARATIEEFLKGPAGVTSSIIPRNTHILGLSLGIDGILYVNLSDEFRSGFAGDALQEFLLLRGLYESTMSNIEGIIDIKVLIGGAETDSLGGHLTLMHPLGMVVSMTLNETSGESAPSGETMGNDE